MHSLVRPIISNMVSNYKLINEVNEAANVALSEIPISDEKLAQLKREQQNHSICKMVLDFCNTKWPSVTHLFPALKPYYM